MKLYSEHGCSFPQSLQEVLCVRSVNYYSVPGNLGSLAVFQERLPGLGIMLKEFRIVSFDLISKLVPSTTRPTLLGERSR